MRAAGADLVAEAAGARSAAPAPPAPPCSPGSCVAPFARFDAVSAARRRHLQARDLSSDLTFERALVEDSRRARQQLAEQIDGMQAARHGAPAARMRRFGAVAAVARGAARIGSRALTDC